MFWRSATQVVGKIQAGDSAGAFRQRESELVGARNAVLDLIKDQLDFQRKLTLTAVYEASLDARKVELFVPTLATVGVLVAGFLSWRLATMLRGAFRRAMTVTQRIARGDLGGEIYVRDGKHADSLQQAVLAFKVESET